MFVKSGPPNTTAQNNAYVSSTPIVGRKDAF